MTEKRQGCLAFRREGVGEMTTETRLYLTRAGSLEDIPQDLCIFIGDFIYPYFFVEAEKEKSVIEILSRKVDRSNVNPIGTYSDLSADKLKETAIRRISQHVIASIKIRISDLRKAINVAWRRIEALPSLLSYGEDITTRKDIDQILIEQSEDHETISKILYELGIIETEINELQHKIGLLRVNFEEERMSRETGEKINPPLNQVSILETAASQLRNELNKTKTKVSTLLQIKRGQIDNISAIITQAQLKGLSETTEDQYALQVEAARDAAGGAIVGIALTWLGLIAVFELFKEENNTYVIAKGLNISLFWIFVFILALWLTVTLFRIGSIVSKKEIVELKDITEGKVRLKRR